MYYTTTTPGETRPAVSSTKGLSSSRSRLLDPSSETSAALESKLNSPSIPHRSPRGIPKDGQVPLDPPPAGYNAGLEEHMERLIAKCATLEHELTLLRAQKHSQEFLYEEQMTALRKQFPARSSASSPLISSPSGFPSDDRASTPSIKDTNSSRNIRHRSTWVSHVFSFDPRSETSQKNTSLECIVPAATPRSEETDRLRAENIKLHRSLEISEGSLEDLWSQVHSVCAEKDKLQAALDESVLRSSKKEQVLEAEVLNATRLIEQLRTEVRILTRQNGQLLVSQASLKERLSATPSSTPTNTHNSSNKTFRDASTDSHDTVRTKSKEQEEVQKIRDELLKEREHHRQVVESIRVQWKTQRRELVNQIERLQNTIEVAGLIAPVEGHAHETGTSSKPPKVDTSAPRSSPPGTSLERYPTRVSPNSRSQSSSASTMSPLATSLSRTYGGSTLQQTSSAELSQHAPLQGSRGAIHTLEDQINMNSLVTQLQEDLRALWSRHQKLELEASVKQTELENQLRHEIDTRRKLQDEVNRQVGNEALARDSRNLTTLPAPQAPLPRTTAHAEDGSASTGHASPPRKPSPAEGYRTQTHPMSVTSSSPLNPSTARPQVSRFCSTSVGSSQRPRISSASVTTNSTRNAVPAAVAVSASTLASAPTNRTSESSPSFRSPTIPMSSVVFRNVTLSTLKPHDAASKEIVKSASPQTQSAESASSSLSLSRASPTGSGRMIKSSRALSPPAHTLVNPISSFHRSSPTRKSSKTIAVASLLTTPQKKRITYPITSTEKGPSPVRKVEVKDTMRPQTNNKLDASGPSRTVLISRYGGTLRGDTQRDRDGTSAASRGFLQVVRSPSTEYRRSDGSVDLTIRETRGYSEVEGDDDYDDDTSVATAHAHETISGTNAHTPLIIPPLKLPQGQEARGNGSIPSTLSELRSSSSREVQRVVIQPSPNNTTRAVDVPTLLYVARGTAHEETEEDTVKSRRTSDSNRSRYPKDVRVTHTSLNISQSDFETSVSSLSSNGVSPF